LSLFRSSCLVVTCKLSSTPYSHTDIYKIILSSSLHHWIHPISARHCCFDECFPSAHNPTYSHIHSLGGLVTSSWYQHLGRLWCGSKPGWISSIPSLCILHWTGSAVFHHLIDFICTIPACSIIMKLDVSDLSWNHDAHQIMNQTK
jgi:hypothetical protein